MKLHTALGTGLIVVGGAAAGMYGTGCVDHDLKLRAAAKEYDIYEGLVSETEKEIRSIREGGIGALCSILKEARHQNYEIIRERCEKNEKKYLPLLDQSYLPVLKEYRRKLAAASEERSHRTNEFWTHARITALGLLLAGLGYAARKDLLSKAPNNPKTG